MRRAVQHVPSRKVHGSIKESIWSLKSGLKKLISFGLYSSSAFILIYSYPFSSAISRKSFSAQQANPTNSGSCNAWLAAALIKKKKMKFRNGIYSSIISEFMRREPKCVPMSSSTASVRYNGHSDRLAKCTCAVNSTYRACLPPYQSHQMCIFEMEHFVCAIVEVNWIHQQIINKTLYKGIEWMNGTFIYPFPAHTHAVLTASDVF